MNNRVKIAACMCIVFCSTLLFGAETEEGKGGNMLPALQKLSPEGVVQRRVVGTQEGNTDIFSPYDVDVEKGLLQKERAIHRSCPEKCFACLDDYCCPSCFDRAEDDLSCTGLLCLPVMSCAIYKLLS